MLRALLKRFRICLYRVSIAASALWILFMPEYVPFVRGGDSAFTIYVNGIETGVSDTRETAEKCLRTARRNLAKKGDPLTLVDVSMKTEGTSLIWGQVDSESIITARMERVLADSTYETLVHCYTVKINKYSVNLATREEVQRLLETALMRFDDTKSYEVSLIADRDRELNVLTTSVTSIARNEWKKKAERKLPSSGIVAAIDEIIREAAPITFGDSLEDYMLGLISMDFGDKVEITESYVPRNDISDLVTAIDDVTKDKEKNQIYEVKSGDTLGGIAEAYGLTLEELISMNEAIADENSTIRPEDEIIVTVPEPELSVVYSTQEYYEEDYEAPVEYIDNNSWYTTQTKTLQEPSAGHRRVVARIDFVNGMEKEREILLEEVTYPAVPKIVERGTIVPPTYIKPISGGRLSSRFGRRKAPKRGASTYHKGIDWATPVGTAVVASNGGVVTKAGWASGYGYCVYIHHADGKDTRYGHLSKVLVKAGQSVKQGEKIALSGNTGVSTGPHLHFEILVGGVQVDPFKFLN